MNWEVLRLIEVLDLTHSLVWITENGKEAVNNQEAGPTKYEFFTKSSKWQLWSKKIKIFIRNSSTAENSHHL